MKKVCWGFIHVRSGEARKFSDNSLFNFRFDTLEPPSDCVSCSCTTYSESNRIEKGNKKFQHYFPYK